MMMSDRGVEREGYNTFVDVSGSAKSRPWRGNIAHDYGTYS